VRVPHTLLHPDTLRGLVESFVTREGTDYGVTERTLASKIEDVLALLDQGEAFVTYDEDSDSCSIVSKNARESVATPSRDDSAKRYERNEQRSYDERSQETGAAEDYSQDFGEV
jgi:uncharacterized protein YheU (UPF0270 family)